MKALTNNVDAKMEVIAFYSEGLGIWSHHSSTDFVLGKKHHTRASQKKIAHTRY